MTDKETVEAYRRMARAMISSLRGCVEALQTPAIKPAFEADPIFFFSKIIDTLERRHVSGMSDAELVEFAKVRETQ